MSTIDTPNPFDDMQPRHTSACCNDCPWTAETISTSVLPLVKAHADEHRHNVTAHAWIKNDNEAPFIIAMVLIPPDADLVARFLSKPNPNRVLVCDEYFDLVADLIRNSVREVPSLERPNSHD